MTRLLIHVEGQTEETFVSEVIAPHLYGFGYQSIGARLIGNARQRGGIKGWDSAREDILRHLREDPGCLMTTMVDYYALPQSGTRAWPGRAEAGSLPFAHKANVIEAALSEDICNEMGVSFNSRRFLPYVVMHEFEALLFSDCLKFAGGIGRPAIAPRFQAIRDQYLTPEEINDSPITAPSKRILALVNSYQKPLMGTLAALEIGLAAIRAECQHFDLWVSRLESWPGQ